MSAEEYPQQGFSDGQFDEFAEMVKALDIDVDSRIELLVSTINDATYALMERVTNPSRFMRTCFWLMNWHDDYKGKDVKSIERMQKSLDTKASELDVARALLSARDIVVKGRYENI